MEQKQANRKPIVIILIMIVMLSITLISTISAVIIVDNGANLDDNSGSTPSIQGDIITAKKIYMSMEYNLVQVFQ